MIFSSLLMPSLHVVHNQSFRHLRTIPLCPSSSPSTSGIIYSRHPRQSPSTLSQAFHRLTHFLRGLSLAKKTLYKTNSVRPFPCLTLLVFLRPRPFIQEERFQFRFQWLHPVVCLQLPVIHLPDTWPVVAMTTGMTNTFTFVLQRFLSHSVPPFLSPIPPPPVFFVTLSHFQPLFFTLSASFSSSFLSNYLLFFFYHNTHFRSVVVSFHPSFHHLPFPLPSPLQQCPSLMKLYLPCTFPSFLPFPLFLSLLSNNLPLSSY